MTTASGDRVIAATAAHGGRRLSGWDPEDPGFWDRTGARVARRNLIFSVFSEHIGFSVWSLWSVLVLFLTPAYGLSADPSMTTSRSNTASASPSAPDKRSARELRQDSLLPAGYRRVPLTRAWSRHTAKHQRPQLIPPSN